MRVAMAVACRKPRCNPEFSTFHELIHRSTAATGEAEYAALLCTIGQKLNQSGELMIFTPKQ